jgi:hypothetical protein
MFANEFQMGMVTLLLERNHYLGYWRIALVTYKV